VERIVFTENWEKPCQEIGLNTFNDFFNVTDGTVIGKNNKRNVISFERAIDSKTKQFFMKRFSRPHFKDIFFAWKSFKRPCSQAQLEWENANFLLKNQIGTYKPVCYGEKYCCGLEKKSFFVTEKLKKQCLTDFLAQNWENTEKARKEKLVKDLGGFIRKIHNFNISLPDLYVWHIFLDEETTGEFEFAVIDLHRMSQNVKKQKHYLKNLGRFHHSMIDKYFDDHLRRLFIEAYAGNDWPKSVDYLETAVKRYSAKISKRRNPKPY